jgi:hypothetical protein
MRRPLGQNGASLESELVKPAIHPPARTTDALLASAVIAVFIAEDPAP